ncbi:MAG: isoprenylcysteine carboxylmethyltransferase family protein [Robiginitomaculum sp.]|nr:isoprenylcysteine carboxylmethyltransferase family protein [Robiginitomaculum sp.]
MEKQDNPGIRFPPPLIFFLCGIAGWLIGSRLGFLVFEQAKITDILGLVLAAFGFLLSAWSMLPFLAAKTSMLPWTSDSKLLIGGPYRFSRNPMYAGMALIYSGVGVLLGSGLVIVLLVPLIVIMNRYVIAGEEAYLTREFGDEYLKFTQKTRRWL